VLECPNRWIANLEFLRSYKYYSHREDEGMLELLRALHLSRNLGGVSEVVEGSSFEHDVRKVDKKIL